MRAQHDVAGSRRRPGSASWQDVARPASARRSGRHASGRHAVPLITLPLGHEPICISSSYSSLMHLRMNRTRSPSLVPHGYTSLHYRRSECCEGGQQPRARSRSRPRTSARASSFSRSCTRYDSLVRPIYDEATRRGNSSWSSHGSPGLALSSVSVTTRPPLGGRVGQVNGQGQRATSRRQGDRATGDRRGGSPPPSAASATSTGRSRKVGSVGR